MSIIQIAWAFIQMSWVKIILILQNYFKKLVIIISGSNSLGKPLKTIKKASIFIQLFMVKTMFNQNKFIKLFVVCIVTWKNLASLKNTTWFFWKCNKIFTAKIRLSASKRSQKLLKTTSINKNSRSRLRPIWELWRFTTQFKGRIIELLQIY